MGKVWSRSMIESAVSFSLAEARELLAASVAHQARLLDVRALLIKGPTLQAHGLRGPRESIDVDLWASPAELNGLLKALNVRGWHVHAEDTTAHLVPLQSITLIHRAWPLELDLHHRFPGFLVEPQVVFDVFWARRQDFCQGEQPVAMPDLLSSILIAALHYERNADTRQEDVADLLERSRGLVRGEDELQDLAELADRTGCADTLRAFLDDLGAPPLGVGRSDPQELEAWYITGHGGWVTGVAWLEALRLAPWHKRPGIIWHALLFTEDELRFRYPAAPPGVRGVWVARYWRLKEAIRALPTALRVLRNGRRTKP